MSTEYPEHEKLKQIQRESQTIGEFIEWLESNGMVVCEWTDGNCDNWMRTTLSTNRLLAKFFDIDLDKLEAEKRQMLDEMRKAG